MRTIDMTRTGANITALRKKNNMSVKMLEEIVGVSAQAIFKWQRGDALPTLDNLVILAYVFGVTLNDIIVITK